MFTFLLGERYRSFYLALDSKVGRHIPKVFNDSFDQCIHRNVPQVTGLAAVRFSRVYKAKIKHVFSQGYNTVILD